MSAPAPVETRKLTVREFHDLEPVLDPDYRYELLDGQIHVIPMPGNPHTTIWRRLHRQLRVQQRHGLCLWEGNVVLDDHSEPWPDLSLLTEDPEARPDNPGVSLAKLVIEVAAASLPKDTHEKLQLYRAAGVPEYWVVDVNGRRVLRHLAPDYAPEAFTAGRLSPQAYPDVSIDVGALF